MSGFPVLAIREFPSYGEIMCGYCFFRFIYIPIAYLFCLNEEIIVSYVVLGLIALLIFRRRNRFYFFCAGWFLLGLASKAGLLATNALMLTTGPISVHLNLFYVWPEG